MKLLDRVYIRAGFDQHFDGRHFTRPDRQHQGCLAIRISALGFSAGIKQHLYHSGVGQFCGLRDWRGSELVSDVQVRLPGDQRSEQFVIDSVDRPVNRARTVGLCFIHIGTRANPLERCFAVACFNKTGETDGLELCARTGTAATSITRMARLKRFTRSSTFLGCCEHQYPRTPNGVRFSRTHQPPVARYASPPGANWLHASGVQTSSPKGLQD